MYRARLCDNFPTQSAALTWPHFVLEYKILVVCLDSLLKQLMAIAGVQKLCIQATEYPVQNRLNEKRLIQRSELLGRLLLSSDRSINGQ
jgi:hypothetical protein